MTSGLINKTPRFHNSFWNAMEISLANVAFSDCIHVSDSKETKLDLSGITFIIDYSIYSAFPAREVLSCIETKRSLSKNTQKQDRGLKLEPSQ